jgi:phage terminase large subunit-like protein
LEQWQRRDIADMFALRTDGLRRYREALLGLARKNGKSTLCAALALYFLVADGEPGAEIYSCAGDKDQARIVFGDAKRMAQASPELASELKFYKDAIEFPALGGVYRVLSAEAYTKEGLNPHAVIFDELHVQPSDDLYTVMTQGSGTRLQPYLIAITTAGYDLDSLCGRRYLHGKRVESGEVEDPTYFFRWREPAASNCDYRDPQIWASANPMFGIALDPQDFAVALTRITENDFRRYRLNQWVTALQAWLAHGAWDGCADPTVKLDPRLPVSVGIDVALRNDSTAVVVAQRQPIEATPDSDEPPRSRTVVRARIWENPHEPGTAEHDAWELNEFEVEEHLKALFVDFPEPAAEVDGELRPGPAFLYDPAYFHRSARVLEGEGLTMIEFPQSDARMIPASQTLFQLVTAGELVHDGDPPLARHVGNATADQKPRGWRLTKPRASGRSTKGPIATTRRKIDGVIACAIASYWAQQPPPERKKSVYEERGIVTL